VNIPRQVLSAAAWTVGGSFLATIAFEDGSGWTGRHILLQTVANILASGPCVALCVFGLPFAVPFAHRRFRVPIDWIFIVGTLVVFGMAGSLAGGLIAMAIGLLSSHQPFFGWYSGTARMAVFFTVIFGMSGVFMHELRARLSAESRLASLEARVDPHFLFNTLNSIAALVRDRPADAERVVEQLSSLMRSSLDSKQSLVPLEDEIAVVRSYLEIERVRFGDRLRFQIDAAPDAGGCVPRMALQTLVENSVKYAVSASREGASIAVTAVRAGDRCRLSVEDDGPGFDPARLPDGHGLHLLKSRLAAAFGGRARLAIESARGRTAVSLDLPFQKPDDPRLHC